MNKVPVRKALKTEPEINLEIATCQNKAFSCSLPVEGGLQYCIRHILQDSKAPYKACTYIFGNGKQCGQAKFSEESSDKKLVKNVSQGREI